jgi:G3E family GTPase
MTERRIRESRVPVTILSGFLGSGKTTLLNRLLADPRGLRIAVVVNEFGEVGIDGQRVAGAQQFVELDNGCLCCALNEDLKKTLFALSERGGFDHLIVETTGLADPLPVAWTFTRPGLDEFYRVDALVTLVDARNVERSLCETTEAGMQIERADLLVLNKLDLVEDEGAAAISAVRRWNEHAPIVHGIRGDVPSDAILAIEGRPLASEGEALTGHGGQAPTFETHSIRVGRLRDRDSLEDLLEDLSPSIYRVKGLVQIEGEDGWVLVNAVAGRYELDPIAPRHEPAEGALVWIWSGLDPNALAARCHAIESDFESN